MNMPIAYCLEVGRYTAEYRTYFEIAKSAAVVVVVVAVDVVVFVVVVW